MSALAQTWWELLVNRTDGTLRGHRRGWVFTPTPLTLAEVTSALESPHPLGVYAVDHQGMSRWLCLDADSEGGRAFLVALAQRFDPLSSFFELSRRGAHLWLLCPPTPWRKVNLVGRALVESAPEPIEVFPKGPGRNGVRLPLTTHPETGERYPVIEPATGEIRSEAELLQLRPAALPQIQPSHHREIRPVSIDSGVRGTFSDLVREVERYTTLRQYGPERAIGRCPFHDDRHPSLSLLGGFWRCWAGCGEGGLQAFRAVAKNRGLEVKDHAI